MASIDRELDDDDDEDFQREYARVRRGGRRGRRSFYDDADYSDNGYDDNERYQGNTGNKEDSYVGDDFEDDDYYYEDDEEVSNKKYDDDDEEYGFFGGGVIPNPLLDSIDPDGAADRFPELARDPRFWFDMLLFVAFLDFLSDIGPRNDLMEWYMDTLTQQ